MELTAREDIEAPIDFVFDQVTDFATFERSIMRRGGDVERMSASDAAEVGTKWRVNFRMRGKERTVRAQIVQVDTPNGLSIDVNSVSADGTMVIELVALSRARTRLIITAEAGAKTIPAKLFFQSLRFARGKTEARFKTMLTNFAEDIDKKYRG
ncbi:SRPBCC family protein [Octadecabacter sp. G9-8]|uniref:SRPBCC family protein n=1 Tax=Octadecabacter dasysiphoniae TaxID=2909341 RepID=A0ABS9CXI9_9RHOB|nr:SRPBCC family protein [Octadecabacter dasysiphoniae]MCF2871110.1 SRPBCC family protein [Octadecabacter dasysiphoniae]